MKQAFKLLFKVVVFHTYYKENICRGLQFMPAETTMAIFKRFSLSIRPLVNGIAVYAGNAGNTGAFLKYIENATAQSAFTFNMLADNAHFTGITAIPVNWVGKLIYNTANTDNTINGQAIPLKETLAANTFSPYLGTLTVNLKDLMANNGQDHATFSINYQSRSTQWQYYVLNKSAVKLDQPAISGTKEIIFSAAQQVLTESGQTALLFSSGNTLIPLSEQPAYKFDLVNHAAQKATTIIKGLPNPDPGYISIAQNYEGQQVASPMYIYI